MSNQVQYLLAGIIVAAAIFAVIRTIVRTARGKRTAINTCASCKLKDYCTRPEKFSAKKCVDKVAQTKN